jgi:PAS domain S-box-containing protein
VRNVSNFNQIKGINLEDISIITDVASQIKLLEEKTIRYEPVLEFASEGIEVTDEKGNILLVNDKFIEMTGIQRDERLHKNIFEVNPDGVLPQVLTKKEAILNAITTAPGMEGRGIANGYPLFKDGKFIGAALFVKDVSQAIQLSKKLNERETYLSEFYKRTSKYFFSDIVSNNSKMKDTLFLANQMAMNEEPVVLIGEDGTGRNIIAQAIHNGSSKNKKPFISFNCADFSEDKKHLELFGYKKNSNPEAVTDKIGLLEIVDGGTIYFENLQELAIPYQTKLIESLKKGRVTRIGETKETTINVRVVASFKEPLLNYHVNGLINEELYEYMKNYCISVPPLRERVEDIPILVNSLIIKISKNAGKHVIGIKQDAMDLLLQYDWAGNLKELEMVMEMIILTLNKELITPEHVQSRLPFKFNKQIENRVIPLEEVEKISILNAIKVFGDSLQGKKKAAEALQISLGTLYNKMRKYDI